MVHCGSLGSNILQIAYIKDEFNLKIPTDAFRFFFELHNLPSALPRDAQLSGANSKLDTLRQEVINSGLPDFTPKRTTKRKTDDAGFDNSNGPQVDSALGGGDPSLARELSNLGIRLDSEEKCPEWTPLNPVRFFNNFCWIWQFICRITATASPPSWENTEWQFCCAQACRIARA